MAVAEEAVAVVVAVATEVSSLPHNTKTCPSEFSVSEQGGKTPLENACFVIDFFLI